VFCWGINVFGRWIYSAVQALVLGEMRNWDLSCCLGEMRNWDLSSWSVSSRPWWNNSEYQLEYGNGHNFNYHVLPLSWILIINVSEFDYFMIIVHFGFIRSSSYCCYRSFM